MNGYPPPTGPRVACDMSHDCAAPVAMIEDSGFVYCAACGTARRYYGERTRKLRPHEVRRIARGEQITRY